MKLVCNRCGKPAQEDKIAGSHCGTFLNEKERGGMFCSGTIIEEEEPFLQTGIKERIKGWAAWFSLGVQSFTLQACEDETQTTGKERAEWYEKQLNTAFDNYKKEIKLEVLQRVKLMFHLHSDASCHTNGYNSLCDMIKKCENEKRGN